VELEPIAVAPSRVAPLLGSLRASGVHSDIGGPDESGTFPWSWFPPAGVVVVDANALRSDVLYGCRKGRRTTLVTAANEGLLRLYAAAHVVEEVAEHYVRWAADGPVGERVLAAVAGSAGFGLRLGGRPVDVLGLPTGCRCLRVLAGRVGT